MTELNSTVVLDTIAKEIIREVQVGRLTNAKLDVIGKYTQQLVDGSDVMSEQLSQNMGTINHAMETCKTSIVATGDVIDRMDSLKLDVDTYDNTIRENSQKVVEIKEGFNEVTEGSHVWMTELMNAQDTQLELINAELEKSVTIAREMSAKYDELQLNKRLLELVGELESITESQNQFEQSVQETLREVALSVTLIQQQGEDIVAKTKELTEEQVVTAGEVQKLYNNIQQSAIPMHVAQSMRIEDGMRETEHIWAELAPIDGIESEVSEHPVEQHASEDVASEGKTFFQRLKDAFKGE